MEAALSPCEVCASPRSTRLFEKENHTFVRCASCGLERISPQPTDETLAKIYGAHYYEAWGLHRDEETVAKLKKATFTYVLDQLPSPAPGDKLLDLGAATGFLLDVAKTRGYDVYGVELSEFGAKAIAEKHGKGHAFQGQLEDATFDGAKPGDFSVITMCDYIEHVRSPRAVLEKVHTWLRPGGHVALTTPDASSLTHSALRSGWSHYKIEHLYYFRRQNMKELLRQAGFTDVSFRPLLKALNLKYIREQFEVYPHPVLSRVARALGKAMPDDLQTRTLRLMTGEMLAVARRA